VLSMKHWGQRHVQYVNRTYRRSSTLWEERFRSCLTQAQDYVLACEGLSMDQSRRLWTGPWLTRCGK
jgi:hypothetical protein